MEAPGCKICGNSFDQEVHRPVILPKCGHTFCATCLTQQLLANGDSSLTCPEDRVRYEQIASVADLPENTSVLGLIKASDGRLCPEHKKALEFYCLDDLKPICSICGLFSEHRQHKILMNRELPSAIADLLGQVRCKFKEMFAEADLAAHQTLFELLTARAKESLSEACREMFSAYKVG